MEFKSPDICLGGIDLGRQRRQKIRALQEQEKTLDTQIEELEAKLGELLDEKTALSEQIRELEMAEEASRFTKTVSKINKENSMVESLYEYTKTTPIMDAFASSDKEFLVFRNIFRLAPSWKYVSLIVTKSRGGVKYAHSNLTMTDLKKASGTHISRNLVDYMPESDRLYPLYLELTRVGKKAAMMEGPIRFDKPCLLGGQTYRDQTGFGWEYCGEELVHRGREYGETTKFMIIGIWVDPSNQ